MKKTFLTSAVIALAGVGLMAGSVMATPLLNELTDDGGTTLLFPTASAIADSGAEAVTLTDTDGTNDDAIATLLFAYAGYYESDLLSFGIYDYSVASNGDVSIGETLLIGDTGAGFSTNWSTTISFDLSAGTAFNGTDYANIGQNFGFYLANSSNGNTFYTHNYLNNDDFDHALIYDTSSILSGPAGLASSDVIVAFEDLYGGGDGDYNDFVFGVSDVTAAPVPEPATMLLFGTGLVGLAGARRKKMKKNS